MCSDDAIVIQVHHFEPILQTPCASFVFFTEHEPHEIIIVHLAFLFRSKFPGHLLEDPLNCSSAQRVAFISREVLFVNEEVVVVVELSEPTVEDIEVFITEVVTDLVDVFFSVNLD